MALARRVIASANRRPWFRTNVIRLLLIAMSLPLQLAIAYADEWGEDSGWRVNIVDLAINWNKYRNQIVLISGVLQCTDETYCAFRSLQILPIIVNIQDLSPNDQKQMVVDCHEECKVDIVGRVDSNALVVSGSKINNLRSSAMGPLL
jgi:hypothetical protein